MPFINGQEIQHGLIDIRIAAEGTPPTSLMSFSTIRYVPRVSKKPVRNDQGKIVSFIFDEMGIEASVTLLLSEWILKKDLLARQNPGLGILQIRMDWSIHYGNSLTQLRTDKLTGVMFESDPVDSKNDQSALYAEIPLFVQDVSRADGPPPMVYRP